MCVYELSDDVVVINVVDQYDGYICGFGKFYIGDVVVVQVYFGWVVCVFDDDQIMCIVKLLEVVQYGGYQG